MAAVGPTATTRPCERTTTVSAWATVLMEAALITPPVGLNLYVVQGMRGRGSIHDVIRGAFPFLAAMIALIALLMAVPDLALWLPKYVMG